MRRVQFTLLVLLSAIVVAPVASAQFIPQPRQPRIWLVLSDGLGPTGGGVASSNDLIQLFRASATVSITPAIGIETSAIRIQQVFIGSRQFSDPSLTSAEADGLSVAVASLARDGPRNTFPSSLVLGGTLLNRPTNDPNKKRLTGGIMAGIEGNLWSPSAGWFDTVAGGRLILMPATYHHPLYLFALSLGVRFG